MSAPDITLRVLFFARLADLAGRRETSLTLPAAATAGDALDRLVAAYRDLAPLRHQIALAVNMAYVPAAEILRDGDELALIPPVSGG